MVNVPQPFEGTKEERTANYRSHSFYGEDGRCWDCDCKPWHEAAFYPCGARVPRIEVEPEEYRQMKLRMLNALTGKEQS